jgi:hypothetical protein
MHDGRFGEARGSESGKISLFESSFGRQIVAMQTPEPRKNRDLAWLTAGLAALVVLFHIGLALKGQGRFRDQHLGAALHYAATRIDLQHTIIPGMNVGDSPTIQELPVWQAAAGLVFKALGTWWGWGNVVSLLLFLPCLYPLFQIGRRYYGERAAWWAVAAFLCQGLVFCYAGEAGTDGFSLAVTIWFWFACVRLLEQPMKWLVPALVLGVLSATAKLPFFLAAGLAAFFLLLKTEGLNWRKLSVLAAVGAVTGVIFLGWTHYTDRLQANAVLPYVDLRLGGNSVEGTTMTFWYFGDLHYRLNPVNWIKAGYRIANDLFGCYALILLFGGALVSRRIHPAAKYLLAGGALSTLVFTHLVLHHHHYYLMFAPAVALLLGAALAASETFLVERSLRPAAVTATGAALLLAGLAQGLISFRALSLDPFPVNIASLIRSHTSPQDKLLVINGGWGGEQFMRTGRQGLSIWDAKIFEDPAKYAQLKQLGYNRLVIVSESPYLNAIQIINPGQTGLPRKMAKDYLTPRVDSWPTVLANDDLIIKEVR